MMDIFTTDNKEAKCAVCGENCSPLGKSRAGTLIPKYNMIEQQDKIVEAIFVHLECINLTAVILPDGLMIGQKIEDN